MARVCITTISVIEGNVEEGKMNNYKIEFKEYIPEYIEEIRKIKYDPAAIYFYEYLTGGFIWEDEIDAIHYYYIDKLFPINYHINFVFAYRNSLILGEE